VTSSTW